MNINESPELFCGRYQRLYRPLYIISGRYRLVIEAAAAFAAGESEINN